MLRNLCVVELSLAAAYIIVQLHKVKLLPMIISQTIIKLSDRNWRQDKGFTEV